MNGKFEVFKGEDDQYYWRLLSGNGQVIATGGEGYTSEANAYRAIGSVQKTVGGILADAAAEQAELSAKSAEEQQPG